MAPCSFAAVEYYRCPIVRRTRMHFQKRSVRIALIVSVALALVGGAFWLRGQRAAAPALPRSVHTVGDAAVSPLHLGALAETGVAELSERALGNIERVLPGITPLADWRAFVPDKITIAPYPDLPIEFEVTSVRREHGRTIWTGRNALDGAFLTTVATEDEWFATLVFPPAGAFEFEIRGGQIAVFEKNHVLDTCGTHLRNPQLRAAEGVQVIDSGNTIAGPIAMAADPVNQSDVVFFYDAEALARNGSISTFESRIINYVESANLALANSNVLNLRWRYVAAYQVPAYPATGDLGDDLDWISGVTSDGRFTSTDISRFVADKAALHGADQVVLYVGGVRNYGGLAWTPPPQGLAAMPVALRSSAIVWNSASTSYMTLAHELGHNFGCYHDRQTEGAADGDGRHHYGHRFRDRSDRDVGTIMSYADFRAPYFSNPDITTSDGFVLGVLESQPKAANNSRVMRENAQGMASTRASIESPAITTHPQSVNVTAGQTLTLTVTASGGNLSYQWKKGGADIIGATSTTYSKGNAVDSDAGTYTVVVSNSVGQAISDPAMVTVSAAVVPSGTPSPAPSPAPSSGGGGSVDGWFAIVAALLLALRARWIRRER